MGGVVIVYLEGEFLACDGIAQMPKMHQVSDQVVLLVLRHTNQFFLNLLERHTQNTLRADVPKSKRGPGSTDKRRQKPPSSHINAPSKPPQCVLIARR